MYNVMNTRNKRLAAGAIVMLFSLVGCYEESDSTGTARDVDALDVRREASEAIGAAGAFAQSTVEQYRQSMRSSIEEADRDIERLKARAASMTGDAKAEADNVIRNLSEQRDTLAQRLDDLRADSADAWQEIKRGLDRAWTDLNEARKSALDRFDD